MVAALFISLLFGFVYIAFLVFISMFYRIYCKTSRNHYKSNNKDSKHRFCSIAVEHIVNTSLNRFCACTTCISLCFCSFFHRCVFLSFFSFTLIIRSIIRCVCRRLLCWLRCFSRLALLFQRIHDFNCCRIIGYNSRLNGCFIVFYRRNLCCVCVRIFFSSSMIFSSNK